MRWLLIFILFFSSLVAPLFAQVAAEEPLNTPPFLLAARGVEKPSAYGKPVVAQVQVVNNELKYRTLLELDEEEGLDVRLLTRRPNGVVWLYDNVDRLYHLEPRWPAATHFVEGVDILLGQRSQWAYFFNRQQTPGSRLYGGTFHVLDLGRCDVHPIVHIREEPLSWPAAWMNAAVSPDGRHLALPRFTRVVVQDLHHRTVYSFAWRPPAGMAENPGLYRPVHFNRRHGVVCVAGPIAPGDKPVIELHDVWRQRRKGHFELPCTDEGLGYRLFSKKSEPAKFYCLAGERLFEITNDAKYFGEVFPQRLRASDGGYYELAQPIDSEDNEGFEVIERVTSWDHRFSLLALKNEMTVLFDHVTSRAVTLPGHEVKSYPLCWLDDLSNPMKTRASR